MSKTTRTHRSRTTTINSSISRFTDRILNFVIFYDGTYKKTFVRTFNYGITTSNRFADSIIMYRCWPRI